MKGIWWAVIIAVAGVNVRLLAGVVVFLQARATSS
jgi:hypothetical protein